VRLLVLNAGSSSLKAALIREPEEDTESRTELQRPPGMAWAEPLSRILETSGPIDGVGYRVVHGGARHSEPMLVDDSVLAELDELRDLAPLHNGPALEVIAAARGALPDVPHVACFDTAFHSTLPPAAYVYPLPYAWFEDWGMRRFGFHGLSVAWSVERAGGLLGRPSAELGLVVAHLGSGCSVTAVWQGRSVDTSMGMTPLEGLMMGTRAGSVDPGLLLDVVSAGRLTMPELADALQHESGLLGVSGVSADLRAVRRAAVEGDQRARLAIDIFVRRAAAAIAAAATCLPRLDGIVFTGGIGEHDAQARSAICSRLGMLGIRQPSSDENGGDALLTPLDAAPAVLRVAAREDLVIARLAYRLLA
jgi:acetate kinase